MAILATPCTPNRRPTFTPPRTPCRPRALSTPLTEEDPELITPLTPSPARLFHGREELEFKHRVARRLFFTPQHGTQSYIPPSPPLTPTPLVMAVSRVQDHTAVSPDMRHTPRHHQHPYQRMHSPTPVQAPMQLRSPVVYRHNNKQTKAAH